MQHSQAEGKYQSGGLFLNLAVLTVLSCFYFIINYCYYNIVVSNVKITDNFKFVCRVGGFVSEVAQDRSRSVYLKVIIIGLVCVIIGMTAAIIFILWKKNGLCSLSHKATVAVTRLWDSILLWRAQHVLSCNTIAQ